MAVNGRLETASLEPQEVPHSKEGKRAQRVRRAVNAGVQRWRAMTARPEEVDSDADAPQSPAHQDLQVSLPRPSRLRVDEAEPPKPPQREAELFKASLFRVLVRLILWFYYAVRFFVSIFWDALCRRNTVQRRAKRLRKILENAGATAVKAGQQLSMRTDLIPYAYTQELEKMLDRLPAFPVEDAIDVLEEATQKPLDETFPVFDKIPIGSASIAYVYQARLTNGKRVAIKVRRPGIGETFAADLRALTWVLRLLELFFLPLGFTRRVIYELQTTFMEELDFVREARYTELFRRSVNQAKFNYAIVPRVHFDFSNKQVLVTDFVSGIQMVDILKAVEYEDQKALASLRALGISPKVIAKRMLQIIRFSGFEGLFFNADPHPANIMVQPDNRLVFIDFGTCGAFSPKELASWRQLLYAQGSDDVNGIVYATLALLEPIAIFDIDEFSQKLEAMFFQDLYAYKSKHAAWWERTSANLWYRVFQLMGEYGVSPNLNTVRMIRATMLSDSLAARLHPTIDHYREYRRYARGADRRAKKRLEKKIRLSASTKWRQAELLFDGAYRFIFLLQRRLDTPFFHFSRMITKASYVSMILIKTTLSFLVAIMALLAAWLSLDALSAAEGHWNGWRVIRDFLFVSPYNEKAVGLQGNLLQLFADQWWYAALVLLMLIFIARRVLRRLRLLEG